MEKIQEQDVEVFENDIDLYLSQFCKENRIEDMTKEPQSRWTAALIYINKHVFKGTNKLKSNKPLNGYVNNSNSNLNKCTCNAYDVNNVNDVLDYYIYLCLVNDKEITFSGFGYLTGISQDTLYGWGNGSRELSVSTSEIYKKLSKGNEDSLEAKLATGNKNPVGVIAILNRRHGWNSPYVSNAPKKTEVLSAAELPNLSEKQTQFIEQTDTNSS
jgi:hypothetical protein